MGVAREAYKEAGLQGPSAVVALPAACLVNAGPYRALRYILHTFDRVLRRSFLMHLMLLIPGHASLYLKALIQCLFTINIHDYFDYFSHIYISLDFKALF